MRPPRGGALLAFLSAFRARNTCRLPCGSNGITIRFFSLTDVPPSLMERRCGSVELLALSTITESAAQPNHYLTEVHAFFGAFSHYRTNSPIATTITSVVRAAAGGRRSAQNCNRRMKAGTSKSRSAASPGSENDRATGWLSSAPAGPRSPLPKSEA